MQLAVAAGGRVIPTGRAVEAAEASPSPPPPHTHTTLLRLRGGLVDSSPNLTEPNAIERGVAPMGGVAWLGVMCAPAWRVGGVSEAAAATQLLELVVSCRLGGGGGQRGW